MFMNWENKYEGISLPEIDVPCISNPNIGMQHIKLNPEKDSI